VKLGDRCAKTHGSAYDTSALLLAQTHADFFHQAVCASTNRKIFPFLQKFKSHLFKKWILQQNNV
jgi:hypothetical protein